MMKLLWLATGLLLAFVPSCTNRRIAETKLSFALKEKIASTDWVLISLEERFSEQELEWLQQHRNQIQNEIVSQIREGSTPAIQIAEYLKLKSALPALREKLLTLRHPYGWEGPDYSKEESYLYDEQYQYHQIYIHTIETISGLPIHNAVSLTSEEKEWLTEVAKAAKIDDGPLEAWCAKWLLMKLNHR